MPYYKVAVAGCGPAGLASALLLQRLGHDVTIFERFPEPSPVGSGLMLQPTGMAVLRYLGLANEATRLGAPISRLNGRSATSGRRVLDVRYEWLGKEASEALGIHRSALFDILHDDARQHAIPIHGGRAVAGTALGRDGRALIFTDGERSPRFDLVIDTLGMRSPLAAQEGQALPYGALWATVDWPADAGFDVHALEQRYVRSAIMVGMMPTGRARDGRSLGTFFWSIRRDKLAEWQARGLAAWKGDVLKIWPEMTPVLAQFSSADQLSFAQYDHRTLPDPVAPRLIHLGDAWHSTSPQLGQGANMALLDAFALGKSLAEESHLQRALRRTTALRRRHVRIYQALSLGLTPFYQSDSRLLPAFRDLVVPYVARLWPATWIQAAMVSGLIGNPLKRLGLDAIPGPTDKVQDGKHG